MRAFIHQRWFLFALIGALLAGMLWPEALKPLVAWLPGDLLVAAVTFIMALPLETSALWRAARRPGPAWLATGINSGVAPVLGWLAGFTLPLEFAVGIVVATAVPCTLATAAVWTRRAGGNDAVAFLVTMITNLACFLVVPAWLWLLVGIRANIEFGLIVWSLIVSVVLPIIVAQMLRQARPIGRWAVRRKHLLSSVAQLGVLVMVLIGAIGCGEKLQSVDEESLVTAGNLAMLVLAVTAVHVILLWLGWRFSHALRFERGDAIAVAFSGSQKTLMVGAYIAMSVGPLAILAMVAYHAVQLIVDTLVADWWRESGEAER